MKALEDNPKKLLASAYIALLVGATVLGFSAVPGSTRAASSSVGIVIPLYTYPTDGSWTAVIQAKHSYPNVPFMAVINPDNGPGHSRDSNYVHGIKDLQAAGVKVLGYVPTAYAADSISSVKAEVDHYNTWYGVDGIMFDEMNNQQGYEAYYSTLGSYVHSLFPDSLTMGNPGTEVPTSYIGTLDVLNVYESNGYPELSFITYAGYSPSNFSVIVIGSSLDTSFLTGLSGVASWVYATDATLPNPYDALPSYFTAEVAALSDIDLPATSSTSTPTSTTTTTSTTTATESVATVTVDSVDLSGDRLTGMWTTWNQNGAVLSTGYTPMSFNGTVGETYLLTVADYQSTVFCHWQDGSTNPQRTVSLSGNVALTAYYSTTGSCPAQTAVVKVASRSVSGVEFTGMWVVVAANRKAVASGYTTLTFNATVGVSYTTSMSNWKDLVFAYWENGSTNPVQTITPAHNATLTAYYYTGGRL